MKKESLITVEKKWGEEIWLVNNEQYCAKFLLVDEGAQCSYHYHPLKKETFYCVTGCGKLIVNGKTETLAPFTRPKTIEPGDKHSFSACYEEPMVILEISTHHDDNDTVRITESTNGMERQI